MDIIIIRNATLRDRKRIRSTSLEKDKITAVRPNIARERPL